MDFSSSLVFTGPTSEADNVLHFMVEPQGAETLAATAEG